MPIYVGGQSADVWAYQDLFELSETGAPINVSGVPPDAFSETGQLWGSPLYDWQVRLPSLPPPDGQAATPVPPAGRLAGGACLAVHSLPLLHSYYIWPLAGVERSCRL